MPRVKFYYRAMVAVRWLWAVITGNRRTADYMRYLWLVLFSL